jgi:hypothetical protein
VYFVQVFMVSPTVTVVGVFVRFRCAASPEYSSSYPLDYRSLSAS